MLQPRSSSWEQAQSRQTHTLAEMQLSLFCAIQPAAASYYAKHPTRERQIYRTWFLKGTDDSTLYEEVARLAQRWNSNGNVGLVVGATQPDSLRKVRSAAPDVWFLAPGVGAQGGDLSAALQNGLRADGLGMLISVSRSVSRAADPRQAVIDLNQAIQREQELFLAASTQAAPYRQPILPG